MAYIFKLLITMRIETKLFNHLCFRESGLTTVLAIIAKKGVNKN